MRGRVARGRSGGQGRWCETARAAEQVSFYTPLSYV